MQSPSVAELTDRAREVFRQIVDSYLETGVPVGSRTLSRHSSLGLSPASIRNVMQDLEELGLLAAPHTSAGRLPTEIGLRMFIDGMMQAAEPSPEERTAIDASLRRGLEALIDRKSFYRLVDCGTHHEVDGQSWFGVWSGGQFFPIIPSSDLPE